MNEHNAYIEGLSIAVNFGPQATREDIMSEFVGESDSLGSADFGHIWLPSLSATWITSWRS